MFAVRWVVSLVYDVREPVAPPELGRTGAARGDDAVERRPPVADVGGGRGLGERATRDSQRHEDERYREQATRHRTPVEIRRPWLQWAGEDPPTATRYTATTGAVRLAQSRSPRDGPARESSHEAADPGGVGPEPGVGGGHGRGAPPARSSASSATGANSPSNSQNKAVTVSCPAGKKVLSAAADVNPGQRRRAHRRRAPQRRPPERHRQRRSRMRRARGQLDGHRPRDLRLPAARPRARDRHQPRSTRPTRASPPPAPPARGCWAWAPTSTPSSARCCSTTSVPIPGSPT